MISVVIPAYNEEERIENSVLELYSYLDNNFNDFEIIVVTNGCRDRTPEIVEKLIDEYPNIYHLNFKNEIGKGGAIIEGFKVARGDIVGFLDADGATHIKSVDTLLNFLINNGIDGVIASRWLPDAKRIGYDSKLRVIASRSFNILVKILFQLNFKDTQCGAKFFKKHAIKKVLPELGLTDWAFDVDLLYRMKKYGFKIVEVPVIWEHKDGSKFDLKRMSVRMLFSIIGLRIKTLPYLSWFGKSKYAGWLYQQLKKL